MIILSTLSIINIILPVVTQMYLILFNWEEIWKIYRSSYQKWPSHRKVQQDKSIVKSLCRQKLGHSWIIYWPRRLCVHHPRWRLQCVAGHYYYHRSVFLSFFGPGGLRAPCVIECAMCSLAIIITIVQSFFLFLFSVFCFWPTSGNLPCAKICFPQYFGITRRYMQKNISFR